MREVRVFVMTPTEGKRLTLGLLCFIPLLRFPDVEVGNEAE